MGHKVHPVGFRLGVIKDWQSKWYSDTNYAEFVQEDNKLREEIKNKYPEAAISLIEIDRQAKDVTITLYTARPGIVIGRGGQRVDEMRQHLEGLVGKRIRLNIQEVRQPELDAYLVARSVAEQIERRVAYRRAMKQAIFRTIQAGAKGIKVSCAGRLGNAEIARRQTSHQGQVPLHTLRADIDYGFTEAHTTLGRIGVKVWIYKGQILPELKVAEVEEKPEEAATEAPTAEAAAKPAEAVVEEAPVEKPEEVPAKAVAEAAPAKEAEEKPEEATAAKAPAAEAAKPAEAVTEEAPPEKPEEAPAAEVKEPAKPRAKKMTKAKAEAKMTEEKAPAEEKPAKASAKEKPAPEAEKPAKPKAKKTTKAKAEDKTNEEEKPAKPKAKKATKAKAEKKDTDVKQDTEEDKPEDAAA
ncbi:MAG: 30S ribosomal protein S3 [Dehalococcoidales bacterium]|nr:30S ribosomal protein S3 [Dehalococcoidales bacterium]